MRILVATTRTEKGPVFLQRIFSVENCDFKLSRSSLDTIKTPIANFARYTDVAAPKSGLSNPVLSGRHRVSFMTTDIAATVYSFASFDENV